MITSCEVPGAELARILDNVSLFCNPKSPYLPGEILLVYTKDTFSAYSCSDYIAALDEAATRRVDSLHADGMVVLKLEDVESLSKIAKGSKAKDYSLEVEFHGDGLAVLTADSEHAFAGCEFRSENWEIVEAILLDEENVEEASIRDAVFQPDRWSKISQLRPKNMPVGYMPILYRGHYLLRFRVGKTFRGVVKALDSDKIPEDMKFDWMT